MCVESVGDVEVICDEGFEPGLRAVDGCGVSLGAKGDVGAAGNRIDVSMIDMSSVEIALTYAEKNRPLPVKTVMNTSSC